MSDFCLKTKQEEIAALRMKIRRGRPTAEEEERFRQLSGQDAASVTRETSSQKKRRLQANKQRQATERKNETPGQAERRKEADRIRAKLRLRRKLWHDGNADKKKLLENRLQEITKRSDQWRVETEDETNKRLLKEIHRKHQEREREMIDEWRRHEEGVEQEKKQKNRQALILGLLVTEDKSVNHYCSDEIFLGLDSLKYYYKLIALGEIDGFRVPRDLTVTPSN